jgi:hypothetical protein
MITKILHFVLIIVAFNSCTTLYKTGQTPDDVYYSPARPFVEEYIETARQEVVIYHPEDRIIRMGINDPRWRNFGQDYRYNHYGVNYGNYYTPYFSPIYSQVFTPQYLPINTSPRKENLGGYSPTINYSSSNTKMGTAKPVKSYNNNNSGSVLGNIIRQIFIPDNSDNGSNYNSNNNSNNNSYYNNNRTYSPPSSNTSSSSSSSGSSSSGGGGAISRPARGGGN